MAAELDVLRTVIGVSMLVFVGRLLATLFSRLGVPEVVGEVSAGIFFGPLALGGMIRIFNEPLIELNDLMLAFSVMGGIIVLFAAGLEFTFADLRTAGLPSAVVGVVGVIAPFLLGYQVTLLLGFEWTVAMLIGAALSATSIAITIRVLEELGQQRSEEGKIMVNAALIDDVLGLAVLSIVLSVAQSLEVPSFTRLILVTAQSLAIWLVMLVSSVYILPRVINVTTLWKSEGLVEALATGAAFGLAATAAVFGLSPIVGAFAAGMALASSNLILQIKAYIEKLKLVFGPLFFAVIGTFVDLRLIVDVNFLFMIVVVVIAIISKVLGCGMPAALFLKSAEKGWKVGVGMVSRGEVGFVVLGLGLAGGILSQDIYSAMLMVILITTIISPVLLKNAYSTRPRKDVS